MTSRNFESFSGLQEGLRHSDVSALRKNESYYL